MIDSPRASPIRFRRLVSGTHFDRHLLDFFGIRYGALSGSAKASGFTGLGFRPGRLDGFKPIDRKVSGLNGSAQAPPPHQCPGESSFYLCVWGRGGGGGLLKRAVCV